MFKIYPLAIKCLILAANSLNFSSNCPSAAAEMTDYFETKSQPIRDELVHPMKILHYLCVIYKHEEPCEGRLSRTVLWEGWGEIPLPDPIMAHDRVKI